MAMITASDESASALRLLLLSLVILFYPCYFYRLLSHRVVAMADIRIIKA